MGKSTMRESIIIISAVALMAAGISAIAVGTWLAVPDGQDTEEEIVIPKSLQPLPEQLASTGDLGQAAGAADRPGHSNNLVSLRVYSVDGEELGEVVRITVAPDGEVSHIFVEAPEFLGLGTRTVRIPASMYERKEDRVELVLTADAVKMLPVAE